MGKKMLEVKNLKTKYVTRFHEDVYAVDGVSFSIEEGKSLGIAGESGCGKSTLGKTLMMLEKATGGQVLFNYDGQFRDITKFNSQEMFEFRRKVQMVFQDPYSALNPQKKIYTSFEEPLKVHGVKTEAEREAVMQRVLKMVNIQPDYLMRYPHEFSGGQRQRIGIARALAVQPSLIIADEPVSALDVSIQAQVLNLMNQLKKEFNLTYIFVAHDLSVVEHISDRVGVMYLGNFVEVGNKESLYQAPLHPYTQALLSAVPVPDPTAKKDRIILEGNIPSPLNPPKGCKFHTRCPKCMDCCKEEAPKKYQVSEDHYVYCHLYDDKIKKGAQPG